jgi:transcriptional regulator with XRE-family HTH domain
MPRPKEHTQHIFDDLDKNPEAGSYGYLSLMFEVFRDIADIRNELCMTQHELAKKARMDQATLAKIEAGKANPTLYQLVKIAHAFGGKLRFRKMSKKEIDALSGVDMESFVE